MTKAAQRPYITRADISVNDRLSFDVAAALAFPDGTVKADTLRHAARQGKLAFACVGNRYFTSLAAIEDAFPLCQGPAKERGSISASGRARAPSGSSATANAKSQRDALLELAKGLKRPRRITSAQS